MRWSSGPSGLARSCRHNVWACVQLCLHPSTVGTRATRLWSVLCQTHWLSGVLGRDVVASLTHEVAEDVERRGITAGARDWVWV